MMNLRAPTNSHGPGGTPARARPHRRWTERLLLVSAASKPALAARLEQLSARLAEPSAPIADIAYTLARGRKAMGHRACVVLPERGDVRGAFEDQGPNTVAGIASPSAASVALMFPGQGAQFPGMGRELYQTCSRYRTTFDHCEAVLRRRVEGNLHQLLLEAPHADGKRRAEQLRQTAIAQPALFLVEYALAELLVHFGLRPTALLGHSVGEFTAACLAGVFQLDAALELVAERGRLMQTLPPGAMLAVQAEPDGFADLLDEDCTLAAHNAPGASVVSGPEPAIALFRERAAARGLEVRALHTSHAFHSAMMEPILDEFRAAVERAKPRPPTIPIISTMTGRPLTDDEATSSEYWARQLRNPVRFAEAARTACDDPARVFVEVGPGTTLLSAVARLSDTEHRPRKLIQTLDHPKAGVPASDAVQRALGQLWIFGAELDWDLFFEAEQRELVRLPTYPYQRRTHRVEPPAVATTGSIVASEPAAPNRVVDVNGDVAPVRVALSQVQALLESRLGRPLDEADLERTFLELGFDSLALGQLVGKVRQRLGAEVRVRQLFDTVRTPLLLTRYLLEQNPALGAAGPAPQPLDTAIANESTAEVRQAGLFAPRTNGANAVPLTVAQREIWLATRIGGETASLGYNECRAFLFQGALDEPSLRHSLDALCSRHEALRQTFTADGNACVTRPHATIPVDYADLRGLAPERAEARLQSLLKAEVQQPFQLDQGPLIRGVLVRLGDERHVLSLCAHHIVVDGASWEVLIRELQELYSARHEQRANRLSQPVPFANAARAERDYLASARADGDLRFWVEHLKGQTDDLDLPTDRPRQPQRTFASARVDQRLPRALVETARHVAARSGCTLQSFLLAAFQALLFRLTQQRDVVCGVPAAGQAAAGFDSLVGHWVNVLPLRFRLHPGATVGDHVRTVADTMLDGLEHQRAASSEILRHLDRPRDPGRPALIQVAFGMGRSQRRPEFAGLETTLQVVPRVSETFELYVYATHDDSGVEVSWSYNEALFDRATIELWQRCFVTLVTEMTGALDRPIATLEVLSLADRAQVLELARGPVVERLGHVPVHRALARQVELQPDRVAVIDSRGVHSYRELDERANRFAHLLRALGVAGGSLVAVCLDRSVDLVAALVGVWRSGSGYVPLDPDHPEERLRRILEDCRPPLVLTSRSLVGRLPEGFRTVCIEDEAEQLGRQPTTPPELASQPSDSAYVIFTSGSTGRPKGVEISQGALENFILSMQKEPGFGRDDSILALTTVGFDISALELFLPLATGGRVLIASQQQAKDPKQIQRLLVEGRVTVMQATPATWQMTFDSGWRGNPHLKALCGGETLSGHLAAALLGSTGEVWNVYGPTETTVWSTAQRVTDASDVSIGRPIDNTTLYVLDEHGALLPPGVHGELWIGGAGVAKGYLGRGDLTRERFVPSPFAASDRLYRTGDVARLRRDGRFECLGRVDHQVKIRGFRIELGEVETALLAQPGVSACAVMARESETGNKTLVGYVVPRRDAQIEVGRLREQLARTLPAYMVPPMYVVLDALPLTPSGKVDRKALPAPEPAHDENGALTESPKDAVEERVLAAWHELLGHRGVLLTDNFYASGGDSLMAVRLVEKLNREFETDLSVSELLAHPTVRALGDRIRGCCTSAEPEQSQAPAASRSDTHHGLFCIQQGRAGGLPLFLIHGDRSDGLLPPHLSPATEIWGYHHQGANGERILLETVESLAQHCHREWLEHHGDRPCVLAGHSFGALVAYHIAVLREQAGLTTPRLILIDARHPAILPSRSVSFTPRALKRRLNELLRQRDAEKSRALAEAHLARGELVPVELRRDYTLGTYRLAFMRYQPPQYRGQLEVIRSEEWTRLSPSDYWERSAVGHIRRFVIPGTHLSIIREPEGVVFVAERMRSLLDEVSEER